MMMFMMGEIIMGMMILCSMLFYFMVVDVVSVVLLRLLMSVWDDEDGRLSY